MTSLRLICSLRPATCRLRAMLLWVVLGKELRETLRDINTVLFSLLFPLFFYPFLLWFYSQASAYLVGAEEGVRPTVSAPADLRARLPDTVAIVEAGADVTLTQSGRDVTLAYRSTSPMSERGRALVGPALEKTPKIESHDIAPKQEQLFAIIAGVLPGLIVTMSLLGSLYPAVEAVIAERERGTLETSMLTAAPRWVFFAGKVGSVVVITLASLAANILSLALTITHTLVLLKVPLTLPPARLLTIVPMAAVASFAGAALCLLAAVPTRDFKQAQNTTSAVATVGMSLAALAMLPRMELTGAMQWVPLANAVLVMREMLLGHEVGGPAIIVTAELLGIAVLAVVVGARLAGREGYR